MQKKTKNRLLLILFFTVSVSLGISIILYNLEQNITFFYPPSKVTADLINAEIRIGGIVKTGSIKNLGSDVIQFTITDNINDMTILYHGLLPALFREKQGVVAKGKFNGEIFKSTELLTKHDENYMPPQLID